MGDRLAVFAPCDGLGPYRRLVDAATTRLAEDGVLLLQLHRRAVEATRAELPALKGALDGNATRGSTAVARLEGDLKAAA